MIQIPGLCTCFVYSSFCFLQMIVLSRYPCPPPPRKYRTHCCSERDINKHTAQRRAISSAQAPLGIIINSPFAPNNHGPLLAAPFIYIFQLLNRCTLPCASVAGGVISLAEPCAFFRTTQSTTRYWAKYQVPGTAVTCVYASFCFFVGFVLHLGPLCDFFFANYTRTTADLNVTSPTYSTAQTGQSAPHK